MLRRIEANATFLARARPARRSAATVATKRELDSLVEDARKSGKRAVAVKFTATWCAPCKLAEPLFAEAEKESSSRASFAKVDVDESQELAAVFGVSAVPTVEIVPVQKSMGTPRRTLVGFDPKKFKREILDGIEAI